MSAAIQNSQTNTELESTNLIPLLSRTEEKPTENSPQVLEAGRRYCPPTTKSATAFSLANEYRSRKLKWLFMSSLILIEAGIIAVIIYLERISATNNGIASVPKVSTSSVASHFSISNLWKYGLLWTSLPSLLMTLYKLLWDSIVSASADRQPFIELLPQRGKKPSNAKVTILLDYRSYPTFYNWLMAFGNRHVILGFSMFLSLVLSIGVNPLSAHLFVAAPSQQTSTVPLSFPTTFNEILDAGTSLQPMIDLGTACRVYGGIPPPWMTIEYAFEKFDFSDTEIGTKSGNVTSETNAYSAYLDCQTFSPTDSSATYSGDSNGGTVTFNFNDRGCQVSSFIGVLNTSSIYALTWQTDCSGSPYGRVGMLAANYDELSPFKLANYSLVSCKPTYWQKSGSLTVSQQPNTPPQYISFTPSNSAPIHPELYLTLETTLNRYKFIDPSNSIQADAFGFSVLSYAGMQNPSSPIIPYLIMDSMEELFTTLYAGLVTTLQLQQTSPPTTANGEFSTPVTRLYVVTPVAYTIVPILFLILVCNILLFIYAEKHHSILYEKPLGILGYAALLNRSEIPEFVSEFQEKHSEVLKIGEFIKEKYDLKEARCYLDEGSGVISVENLREKDVKRKRRRC